MSVRVFAPAKINLTLKVGRARADGMHPLQSVVAFAPGAEWVEAAPADRLSLTMIGPFAADLEADDSNLVLRAANALAGAAGIKAPGAALTLYKDYPVASGIGGGSSDAAAALKALNALWGLDLDETALAVLARDLGSDVPVCVGARAAYMTGLGEQYTPFDLPSLHVMLINPRRPLATAHVYRQFDAMGLGGAFDESASMPKWPDIGAAVAGISVLGNDLAAPAAALMPELEAIVSNLREDRRVLYAGMSGSGATLFALCETKEHALGVQAAALAANAAYWARVATLT